MLDPQSYTVIKASGEEVPFVKEKLVNSLKRAGSDALLAEEIADGILAEMHDGISTKEIYGKAFQRLKKKQNSAAARYSLKNAILELGPAGYPFEGFMARLLQHKGYNAITNQILSGKCIAHEVDVLAGKADAVIFIECKYHTDQGRKSDVKTALYFHSRFRDLEASSDFDEKMTKEGWLVTNTRFSEDAVKYGECMGFKLISWNQPQHKALKEMIEESGLHPVTCLTTITSAEKRTLIGEGILLCAELLANRERLQQLLESKKRIDHIITEAEELCRI